MQVFLTLKITFWMVVLHGNLHQMTQVDRQQDVLDQTMSSTTLTQLQDLIDEHSERLGSGAYTSMSNVVKRLFDEYNTVVGIWWLV